MRSAFELGNIFCKKVTKDQLTWGQEKPGSYFVDFVDNGERLIVTFEPMHPADNMVTRQDGERLAWGMKLFARSGFSVLGVKAIHNDWYRGPELQRFFEVLQSSGFFARFSQIIFYGGSMGGFGALTLSAIVPGATVIALNPQSSLDPDVVPWETRFSEGRSAGWEGPLADAAVTSHQAAKIWVCYDPFLVNDVRHIRRLSAHNIVELKLPGVGHSTQVALSQMAILKKVVLDIANGDMTVAKFAQMARGRRDILAYWSYMSWHLAKHPRWQTYFLNRAAEMKRDIPATRRLATVQP